MKRIIYLILAVVVLCGSMSCGTVPEGMEDIQKPYYFFVYNSNKITEHDLSAIYELQKLYLDCEIVMMDVCGLDGAAEVYRFLRSERDLRAFNPSGIQIFGNLVSVPAFVHRYEIEEFHTAGASEMSLYDSFVSDYFYTNFDNDPDKIDEISAYRLSQTLNQADIIPDWPVVRLPLSPGQYSEFFEKYREYLSTIAEQELVSISIASPIFPVGWYSVAMDDDGYFLMRTRDEWGMLRNLKTYGTTEGVYPSSLELDGSCEAENWAYLTESNLCEIYHSGHASETMLTQTIFDGRTKNEYHCEAILDIKSINRVLEGKPYLLNTFGCESAKDMTLNIINTALRGRCVGAIASTTRVSNVDVDCMLPAEDYDVGYTRYTLLYEYLLAKSNGATRAEAFHAGQHQVAESLLQNSEIIHAHSLQTNLNNLLGFHNFGIIDP